MHGMNQDTLAGQLGLHSPLIAIHQSKPNQDAVRAVVFCNIFTAARENENLATAMHWVRTLHVRPMACLQLPLQRDHEMRK